MQVPGSANALMLGGARDYTIARSLRFRSSASAYLSRTPASAGNRRTFTYSNWIKRGKLSSAQTILSAGISTSSNPRVDWQFNASDQIEIDMNSSGSSWDCLLTTSQVFRDPSAFYHIVVAVDTTQATASNRVKIYINGVQVTALSSSTYPAQNADMPVNNTIPHGLYGYIVGATQYVDGYAADTYLIDGQALTPSSFGEFDLTTGVWKPKRYAGTYGTNGFKLDFSDNSAATAAAIGKDSSGNGNNWTPNNISVTAGVTYDSMTDVPTLTSATASNYCVLNPLNTDSNITVRDGNLFATWTGSANKDTLATIAPTSGKFYCEVYQSAGATADVVTGFCLVNYNRNAFNMVGDSSAQYLGYTYAGRKWDKGAQTNGLTTLSVSADYLCFAIDYDAGKAWAGKNGVWFASGDPATGANPFWTFTANSQYTFGSPIFNGSFSVNFGQRPFAYTPPTGFVALNTFNLPTPSIKKPNSNFDVSIYTGNGSTQTITNGGSFQPDFVWVKSRSNGTYNHVLSDSVRGVSKWIYSDSTTAEASAAGYGVTSFNSNGFGAGLGAIFNENAGSYVGWQWKAGGSAVSNTAGSITSQVSANPSAGFSIVTYTGTGVAGATVGHGLGVAPSMIIWKNRASAGTNWITYHKSLGVNQYIFLNLTNSAATNANTFGVSSTTFTLGTTTPDFNGTSVVAYCFSEVAGYSKFGTYTGNGSADGVFVYTGFRPAYVMLKSSDNVTSWWVFDSKRNTYNAVDLGLIPNATNADTSGYPLDFLSNGFKFRNSNGDFNGSGRNYIYACFSENPMKYALAR